MAQQWTRWMTTVGVLAAGALLLAGCPGRKDEQQLRPLSELREPAQPGEVAERGPQGESSKGTESSAEMGSDYDQGDTAYSTGTAGWRVPSTGRNTGDDMTFGGGTSDKAPGGAWAINTDSTGGVGDALGLGTTYGASRGTVTVNPGTPATRAEPQAVTATGKARARP